MFFDMLLDIVLFWFWILLLSKRLYVYLKKKNLEKGKMKFIVENILNYGVYISVLKLLWSKCIWMLKVDVGKYM